ncbi:hypothetical protein ANCDUO_11502 [Ancylostoma duodenale]|uniref:SCP domain-containing protein n=1 Tax=Ancylostoma duodenale TaxID=51022 RepID=A0A0C2GHE9_9BILA|nr:hypothetical protein ANCDUO_11502 [Ancylostoma duodenale]
MWGILLLLSAVFPKIFVPVKGTTAFNCRNSLLSDEWRQYVIDELNAYRRSLALGEVYDKTKNYLPMAKNMNELMANATITAFACTYDFCNNMPKGIMVCVSDNTTPNPVNFMLYEKASDKQEICSACKDNCTKYLCPQPHTPVTLPTTCSDDKLTQDSNNAALWMHNYYRKLLASGWAKDKKSKSSYALPAKQMVALEYDCAKGTENGAKKTYELIKNCPSTTPPPTRGYSSNFLSLSNITVPEQDALEHMAYEKVSKVACAVKNCSASGKTLVACQYNSVINAGDKIYEPGKVCSGCKGLNKKCSNPAGLCE